jgi:hypothetical protein
MAWAGPIPATDIIDPFISLLQTPYLAGPFKIAALEAIQAFVGLNVFPVDRAASAEAVSSLVDAITR